MVARPLILAVGVACLLAAYVWGRSALRISRAYRRLAHQEIAGGEPSAAVILTRSSLRKELHTTGLYALLGAGCIVISMSDGRLNDAASLIVLLPVAVSLRYGPRFLAEARLAEERAAIERRAEEVLAQEELAPLRWSARLAPEDLPPIEGFEVSTVYEPGTGAMAGDFFDLYPTGTGRVAAVIGDVAGHGIEPSITAFQVKYLLRVFLQRYRDPAQAIEELNTVLSAQGRPEDLVSLCAVVFDPRAGTLRFASAGHPAAWLWSDGELRPLRSTGPLLTLDPKGTYTSRELALHEGDVVLLYTDGLAEARAGGQLFGEERVGGVLRRDPGQAMETLCKNLVEAARDFATEPISDDIAVLAIRRT